MKHRGARILGLGMVGVVASGTVGLLLSQSGGARRPAPSFHFSAQEPELLRHLFRLFRGGLAQIEPNAKADLRDLEATDLYNLFYGSASYSFLPMANQLDWMFQTIAANPGACVEAPSAPNPPLQYSVTVFSGNGTPRTIPMYAQCYVHNPQFSGDPGYKFIGVNNGVTYLWMPSGNTWILATLDPNAPYSLHVIYSYGLGNSPYWDSAAYGVGEFETNMNRVGPEFHGPTHTEMVVAGVNTGYCGLQFNTDAVSFNGKGSAAAGSTCAAVDTFCDAVGGGQFTPTKTTAPSGICQSSFDLQPIGIIATTGASGASYGGSNYPSPATDTIALDGSWTDSVHFQGPTGPTGPLAGLPQVGTLSPLPTPSPSLLAMPVASASPMPVWIDNVYVSAGSQQFMGKHLGIHFSPTGLPSPLPMPSYSTVPYLAMADGTITDVSRHYTTSHTDLLTSNEFSSTCVSSNGESGGDVCSWNVTVTEQVTPTLSVEYLFETMAGNPWDDPVTAPTGVLATQLGALSSAINVGGVEGHHLNVTVHQGDTIGTLMSVNGSTPILHISFMIAGTPAGPQSMCPVLGTTASPSVSFPLLSSDAAGLTLSTLENHTPVPMPSPGWALCY